MTGPEPPRHEVAYVGANPTTYTDLYGFAIGKGVGGGGKAPTKVFAHSPVKGNGPNVNDPSSDQDLKNLRHGPTCAYEGMKPSCGGAAGSPASGASCPPSDVWCAIFGDLSDPWSNLNNLSHGLFDTLTWNPIVALITGNPSWSLTGALRDAFPDAFTSPALNAFYTYGAITAGLAAGGSGGVRSTAATVPASTAASPGTVWAMVTPTAANSVGPVVPKTFIMTADGGARFWVNSNGTKHLSEYATGLGASGPMATQAQLTSLQQAVSAASRQGITLGREVVVGGWELKFSQSAGDALPVLVHALYVG